MPETEGNPFKTPPAEEAKPVVSRAGPRRQKAPRAPREKKAAKAKPTGPKVNMSETLGIAWATVGTGLAMTGRPATGTVMQIQGPYAGKQLNKVIQGSDLLYGMLSPILGKGNTAGALGSIVGPLVIMGMMESSPESRDGLMPLFRVLMRPAMREMVLDMKREKEVLKDLAGGDGDEETEREIDTLFDRVFGMGEVEPDIGPDDGSDTDPQVPLSVV